MSKTLAKLFREVSTEKAQDIRLKKTIQAHVEDFPEALANGEKQFKDIENAKTKAHLIKWKTIENIDRHLLNFERNFQNKGGQVIWANTAEDARNEILEILKERNFKKTAKSKSNVLEEIKIKSFLKNRDYEVVESDMGDFLVSAVNQSSSHRVHSAVHLSMEDVETVFTGAEDKENQDKSHFISELSTSIRTDGKECEVLLSGANFLISDSGSVAISENEGNIRFASSQCSLHIVVAGIEKVLPKMEDLDLFWPLLSTHSSGQPLTSYNSLFNGPRKVYETEGPEEMIVVLLDNGRSQLLEKEEQREALYCIGCGACLNVSSVYKTIGGHTYNADYAGPIGSVVMPHLKGMNTYKHLSFASTLCGECQKVCPVKIDMDRLLLLNRRDTVRENMQAPVEYKGWKYFLRIFKNRKILDFFSGKIKNKILNLFSKKIWSNKSDQPVFAPKSFAQQWKEKRKEEEKNRN